MLLGANNIYLHEPQGLSCAEWIQRQAIKDNVISKPSGNASASHRMTSNLHVKLPAGDDWMGHQQAIGKCTHQQAIRKCNHQASRWLADGKLICM